MNYVVDTCLINHLVDGKIAPDSLPLDGEYVATHIQREELEATRNEYRREILLKKFSEIVKSTIPTETRIFGISRFGQGNFGDGKLHTSLQSSLDNVNDKHRNNTKDCLIAEVAIKKGYTLLTTDRDLKEVAQKHGGRVIYWNPATGECEY